MAFHGNFRQRQSIPYLQSGQSITITNTNTTNTTTITINGPSAATPPQYGGNNQHSYLGNMGLQKAPTNAQMWALKNSPQQYQQYQQQPQQYHPQQYQQPQIVFAPPFGQPFVVQPGVGTPKRVLFY